MAVLDEAAWADVRKLYETSELSVREIARRYGTTLARIYQQRAADGWPMRSQMTPDMIASAEARYRGSVSPVRPGEAGLPAPPDAATAAPATQKNRRTAGRRNGRGARYGRPVGARAMGREALLSRMVRLAERNLAIMEQHMESENGHTTAEERERSTRTLGTLMRTLEKVTELKTPDDDAAAASDIDRNATAELRRELAERIFRMWGRPKR